jgi:Bacterial Ig domain
MANMNISYLAINEDTNPRTIISYLAIDDTVSVDPTLMISWLEIASAGIIVSPKVLVSYLDIEKLTAALPGIIGFSNKPIPVRGNATGTNIVVTVVPRVLISFLEINTPVLPAKGISNKQISINGSSNGTNSVLPRILISYLDIERLTAALSEIIGFSNKLIPVKGSAIGNNTIVTVSPKLIISFLEINTPDIITTTGISNKPVPRITGTSKGTVKTVIGPIIKSITPADGTIITKTNTKLAVIAVVDKGTYSISKVEMFLDNVIKARDTMSPYKFTWNIGRTTRGTHVISIKAYDVAGNISYAKSTVKVI